jgi:putative protein-disulfide isomerase
LFYFKQIGSLFFDMEKPKLIYIYDALCGWCYGFSPVMQKIYDTYQDRLDFEVLSGGMISGHRIQPISGMAAYIRQASALLAEVTGVAPSQKYNSLILDAGTYLSNSLPPAIALIILKEAQPTAQVPMAHAIQCLLYEEGEDLNRVESYLPLAAGYGVGEDDFRQKFEDSAYSEKANAEFNQVKSWGIDGFPAVLGKRGNEFFLLAHGYQPYEQFSEAVAQLLQE